MDDNNTYITVAEAARRLNRSTEQVRRYLREGKLPGRRIGGQWFIEEDAIGYRRGGVNLDRVREVAAMEYTTKGGSAMERLIARINANREAIRARLGGDLPVDIVEMVREDREQH